MMKNYIAENRKYLFFFYKLSVFILVLFVLDYGIGSTLRYFYFKQTSGKQYRTTYTMQEVKTDILVLGSSRANHHYHPDVFENVLGISFYNAGRDGNYIFYHYAVLRSVLKRYTPGIVILDIVRDEFSVDQFSYDRLSSLLPYYRDHPEIRKIIELRGPYEKIKLISSIYPYNSSIFSIIAGNLGMGIDIGREKKGYIPLTKTLSGSLPEKAQAPVSGTDPNKIAAYESLIDECISSGVRLFIICSPYYTPPADIETIDSAKAIADKYGVPFFNYSYDSAFIDRPDLFADFGHLNDAGAKIFSAIIAHKIQEEISMPREKSKYLRYELPLAEE